MPILKVPSLLIDLGHVGENGLPINAAAWFQRELELCKEWGFRLKIADGRVSLEFDQDQLVPYWIEQETPAIAWNLLRVNGFFRTHSTNSEALELVRKGAPSGTLVITEEQTAGKGRNGRSWFSNAKKGLYFTAVLRPSQDVQFWPLLTHVASIALVETLKDLHVLKVMSKPLDIDLKWPNDVMISGRKCAGILLEATSDGTANAAIVGVGINIRKGSVPEPLQAVASCLDDMSDTLVPRRQVLVHFLKRFQECYTIFERGDHSELLERWKSHSSMWKDTRVWITEGEERRSATTCGLNEIGALMVKTDDGNIETVLAADVSVSKAEEIRFK
jgi:BirA family transcriptional regulator, biotin operon repressor / biotin---[acetyl-CoA-carboxylase] ligase